MNTSASTTAEVGLSSPQRRRNSTSVSVNAGVSMQTWTLEEPGPIARCDRHLEGAPVAIEHERHVDAGVSKRPHLAEHGGKLAHLAAGDRQDDVAGANVGGLRRAAAREPDDHDLVFHLGRVQAEP